MLDRRQRQVIFLVVWTVSHLCSASTPPPPGIVPSLPPSSRPPHSHAGQQHAASTLTAALTTATDQRPGSGAASRSHGSSSSRSLRGAVAATRRGDGRRLYVEGRRRQAWLPKSQEKTHQNILYQFGRENEKLPVLDDGVGVDDDDVILDDIESNSLSDDQSAESTIGSAIIVNKNKKEDSLLEEKEKEMKYEMKSTLGKNLKIEDASKNVSKSSGSTEKKVTLTDASGESPKHDNGAPHDARNKSDVHLDHSDMRSWKHDLLKKIGKIQLPKNIHSRMYEPLSFKHFDLPTPAPSHSSNFIGSVDEMTSRVTIESSTEVSSAEVKDLALKKWLKSSSKSEGSTEEEQNTIAELSYRILSQVHPEEESKDEENDKEIFKAVVASMAAYQIRKLQKKLRNGRVKRDEEMVCYKDLGCFRDDGAFDYLDVLPSPPEEVNTKFLLFTRHNADSEQIFTISNSSSMVDSHFDPLKLTKVIIHGFGSSCYRVWVREMRVALLTMVDVNLICVDWENGATVPNYMRAASNTRLVGRQVGLMIEALIAATNTTLDQFHLIGFSLGAHVSGHAGKKLKLKRISGLDPAGPMFENFPPSVRLDASDAEFVDVIHTNAESLIWGGLGAYQAMGHVDFYPNGGRMQKGCANLFVGGVSDILWPTEGDGRSLCNHRRGYKYFVESIAPVCKFPAFVCQDHETFLKGDCFPCKGCGSMGYYSDKAEGRGQLYLVTRDSEPFCANQYKVSLKHSGGPPLLSAVSTYGRIDVTFIGADGINETIPLTRMPDDELQAGSTSVRILVPHPAITGIRSVQLLYSAYDGWLSSGSKRWAIDKVSLMDSFGTQHSFCQLGVTLETGVPMTVQLRPGDCMPHFTPWRQNTQSGTPDKAQSGLVLAPQPQPPLHGPRHNTSSSDASLGTTGTQPAKQDRDHKDDDEPNGTRDKDPQKGTVTKFIPPANDPKTSEESTNFAVIRPIVQNVPSSSGSPHSSVIISFPKAPAFSQSSTDHPSRDPTKSASASFSFSHPSAPIAAHFPQQSSHNSVSSFEFSSATHPEYPNSRYPWTSDTDDHRVGSHFTANGNNLTKYQFNSTNVMIVTSQPVHNSGDMGTADSVKVLANETRPKGSNIIDGPAPNLYPTGLTDTALDEHPAKDRTASSEGGGGGDGATHEPAAPTDNVNGTLGNRTTNYQSHVVIKVNENEAQLWGLGGYRTHTDQLFRDATRLVQEAIGTGLVNQSVQHNHHHHSSLSQDTSSSSSADASVSRYPSHVQTNGHQSGGMDLLPVTSTTTPQSTTGAFAGKPAQKFESTHSGGSLAGSGGEKHVSTSPPTDTTTSTAPTTEREFTYVLQDDKSNSQTLLLLGRPNSATGSNPLAPFLQNADPNTGQFDSDQRNIGVISYNSLVDGEVPINERARALFGKTSDKNTVVKTEASEEDKSGHKEGDKVGDMNTGSTEATPSFSDSQHHVASSPLFSPGHASPDSPSHPEHSLVPNQAAAAAANTAPIHGNRPRAHVVSETPYLSLNLRPPAPVYYRPRYRSPIRPDAISQPNINVFKTRFDSQQSNNPYTKQTSSVIPQIFADQLASLSMEEPAVAGRRPNIVRSNKAAHDGAQAAALMKPKPTTGAVPETTTQTRVRGDKIHTPTKEQAVTEGPAPYSWGYFFGRRSSEETEDEKHEATLVNKDASNSQPTDNSKDNQELKERDLFHQPNTAWQLHHQSQRHFQQQQQRGKQRFQRLIQHQHQFNQQTQGQQQQRAQQPQLQENFPQQQQKHHQQQPQHQQHQSSQPHAQQYPQYPVDQQLPGQAQGGHSAAHSRTQASQIHDRPAGAHQEAKGKPPVEPAVNQERLGTQPPKAGNGRMPDLSNGRRHLPTPAYRFRPRILTAAGNFRRLPANPKHPIYTKHFPPNFPFHQLNPFTALPTRLIAPPPPSLAAKRQQEPQPDQQAAASEGVVVITESREHADSQLHEEEQQLLITKPETLNNNTEINSSSSSASNFSTPNDGKKELQSESGRSGKKIDDHDLPIMTNSAVKEQTINSSTTVKLHTEQQRKPESQDKPQSFSISSLETKFKELSQPILDVLQQHFSVAPQFQNSNDEEEAPRLEPHVQQTNPSALHIPAPFLQHFEPEDSIRFSYSHGQHQLPHQQEQLAQSYSFHSANLNNPASSHPPQRSVHSTPNQPSTVLQHHSPLSQQSPKLSPFSPHYVPYKPLNTDDNGAISQTIREHPPSNSPQHQQSSFSTVLPNHSFSNPSSNQARYPPVPKPISAALYSRPSAPSPIISYKTFVSNPAESISSEYHPSGHGGSRSSHSFYNAKLPEASHHSPSSAGQFFGPSPNTEPASHGVSGRMSHGRSLSGEGSIPQASGRGAVYTPLDLPSVDSEISRHRNF